MENDNLFDPLTGVYSRAALGPRLEAEQNRASRNKNAFSILMIDLDHFKSINDAFGHQRGDQVLVEAAQRMRAYSRLSDEVYRFGGDEFLILLPDTQRQEAAGVAKRILNGILDAPLSDDQPISFSVSIGVASYPEDSHSIDELIAQADKRVYQSKSLGRGRVTWQDIDEFKIPMRTSPEHLIERDQALKHLKQFFAVLGEQERNVLRVSAPGGVGQRRFLIEARRLADLQGYETLWIEGQPALRTRQYGALVDGLVSLPANPEYITLPTILEVLAELSNRKETPGLVILIHQWANLDQDSLEAMRAVYQSESLPRLGVIYSGKGDGEIPLSGRKPVPQTECNLSPLTNEGVKIWLRSVLKTEPEDRLVTRFWEATKGYPRAIKQTLDRLVQYRWLQKNGRHWELSSRAKLATLEEISQYSELPLGNLTWPQVSLIGRTKETTETKKLMDESPLVNIIGPDGIGKSSLALQIAIELQDEFRDGVFWTRFDPGSSLDTAVSLLAGDLGLELSASAEPLKELNQSLAQKRMLICLDDLDNIRNGSILAQALLSSHNLKILATSKTPLGLEVEVTYALRGLQTPPPDHPGAPNFPSFQLFLRHARPLEPDLDKDAAEISRICRLVDGIPLAIEISARWAASFTFQQVIERLTSSIAAEDMGDSEIGARLQATFMAAWQMLNGAERDLLCRMSFMQGRFNQNAAIRIFDVSPFFLQALTTFGLLKLVDIDYYQFHPAFHLFLQLKRDEHPSHLPAQQWHSEYYLGFLENNKMELEAPSSHKPVFREALLQMSNFRSAWDWALLQDERENLYSALPGLMALMRNSAYFLEAITILKNTWARLANLDELDPFRLRVLRYLGEFYYHIGEYQAGIEWIKPALNAPHLIGTPADHVALLNYVASMHSSLGHFSSADKLLRQAIRIAKQSGNLQLQYSTQTFLGVLLYRQGKWMAAAKEMEITLSLARQTGDSSKVASALNNLGNAYFEAGDYQQARVMAKESIDLVKQYQVKPLSISILDTYGKISARCGEFNESARAFLDGLSAIRKFPATPLLLELLVGIAEMWDLAGYRALSLQLALACIRFEKTPVDILQRAKTLGARLLPQDQDDFENPWEKLALDELTERVTEVLLSDRFARMQPDQVSQT